MRNLWLSCVLVALVSAASVLAEDGPSKAKLGEKIGNLQFTDSAGKTHELYGLKEQKAIVLVFLSFDCPVSNGYSEPLADLSKEFGPHNVTFWGLTINDDESLDEIAKSKKDFAIPFPVFKDVGQKAANALRANITPEVFVLDGNYILRYRGRIDDSYSARLKKHSKIGRHDLSQALAEILTNRPVSEPATLAIGCAIARPEREIAKTGKVTYHRDVLPILQNHCQSCHRPGEVGPFSLLTFKQAVNWAEDIKSYTQTRQMPPWKPVDGATFHHDRRMTEADIATLAHWVDNGTPEGDPKTAPPAKEFPKGWQLGTPDLILQADDDFTLAPTGKDLFRCFVMPTNLKEDVHVAAVEVRPSNPRVVHHALLFVDTKEQGRKLEKEEQEKAKKPIKSDGHDGSTDRGPGYTVNMGVGFVPASGMSGWAPGHMPRYLPDGVAFPLPKNSDVVMQIHFHRNGRAERDRTQVGLYFAKNKVERPYQGGILAGNNQAAIKLFFVIPAGADHHVITGDTYATGDFTLFSVMPHMHMLGKEIKVTMTPPGQTEQTLIEIKEWDYNWQETYQLKEPMQIKAGTHFHVEAVYDNSAKNPRNPFSPPRAVMYGEQTYNEMCFIFLGGYSDRPGAGRLGRGLPMSPNAPKSENKTATP